MSCFEPKFLISFSPNHRKPTQKNFHHNLYLDLNKLGLSNATTLCRQAVWMAFPYRNPYNAKNLKIAYNFYCSGQIL